MADNLEAVLSCGDVVTEWADRQQRSSVHWTRCPHLSCSNRWRLVVEIRPHAATADQEAT